MSNDASSRLSELIRIELGSIPADHWRYFFPAQVAVWRFIAERRPDLLGDFRGGFDTEPYFEGRGAEAFIDLWEQDDRYWQLLELIMRPVVDATAPLLRKYGFLTLDQVPALAAGPVDELAALIDSRLRLPRG